MTQRLLYKSSGSPGPVEALEMARWWEANSDQFRGTELSVDPESLVVGRVEELWLGSIRIGLSQGPISGFHSAVKSSSFQLTINLASSPVIATGRPRKFEVPTGCAALWDFAGGGSFVCPGGNRTLALTIPRPVILGALRNAEDLDASILSSENEALRLLTRQIRCWIDDPDFTDPALLAVSGRHLLDLVVLAFGSDRDQIEASRLGGLRATRLEGVLRAIRAEYANPAVSPERVAARLGITTRYMNKLLHETGMSFAERVQELRLERAFALLTSETGAARKVHEAAYEAGFSDLSHFNRQFRRKYGLTPTAARGRGD
jgi:AraC-like DNA-binding protein